MSKLRLAVILVSLTMSTGCGQSQEAPVQGNEGLESEATASGVTGTPGSSTTETTSTDTVGMEEMNTTAPTGTLPTPTDTGTRNES